MKDTLDSFLSFRFPSTNDKGPIKLKASLLTFVVPRILVLPTREFFKQNLEPGLSDALGIPVHWEFFQETSPWWPSKTGFLSKYSYRDALS